MKILISGLIAGLILSLSLSASASSSERELVCVFTEGADQSVARSYDSISGISYNTRSGVLVTARTDDESVFLSMEYNGFKFNSRRNESITINFAPEGKEAVSVSCHLVKEPVGC